MTRFLLSLLSATALVGCADASEPSAAETPQAFDMATTMPATTGETTGIIDPAILAENAAYAAPDSAWRTVDPDNLMVVDTSYGRMMIELFPELAPAHVERIQSLSKSGFYDGIVFHRVIDGFMNQTGDPTGTGTGDSGLPDLPGEFAFRRGNDMPVALVGTMTTPAGSMATGFYKGLPIATKPSSQAILTKDGKVEAYGLHCNGVTSMARTGDPNSANSQFFLMRDAAPHLDAQYSVWGRVVSGLPVTQAIRLTEVNGQPVADLTPDKMDKVQLASQLDDVPTVQVLDTQSKAFQAFLETQKTNGAYPAICDIEVPSRMK